MKAYYDSLVSFSLITLSYASLDMIAKYNKKDR